MTEFLARSCPEELKPFYQLAERFAKKELEPNALELDHYPYSEFNQKALAQAQGIGLLKLTLPESLGGSGQGMLALSLILSRLSQADASFAGVLFLNTLSQSALLRMAKKEIKEKYLSSSSLLYAFPAYAPIANLPLEVKAQKNHNVYLLNGKISYLCLAPLAQLLIIPAEIDGTGKPSFFLIEKDSPGIKISEPILSLGLRNCPVADVELGELKLTRENLLGEEGKAEEEYLELSAHFSPAWLGLSLGVLIGAYHTARRFAQERYQGGKQIIEHDQVRMMLANMALLIEVAEALMIKASILVEEGKEPTPGLAMAIFITDAITRATTDAVQCLGGYGYMHDYGQEKRMRDAKQIQAFFGPAPLKRLEFFQKQISPE